MEKASNAPTIKQGIKFMKEIKKLTKEDFEKCSNIIILLSHAINTNRPINYSLCVPRDKFDSNKQT